MLSKVQTPLMDLTMIWMTFVSISLVSSNDVCSSISNPNCHCTNSLLTLPKLVITCKLTSNPLTPLFASHDVHDNISVGTLDLSGNALKAFPNHFFLGVTAVEKLDLSNNSFTSIPSILSPFNGVKTLDLSRNEIESISLSKLASIRGLQTLDLSRNKLSNLSVKVQAEGVIQFQDLKSLNLSWNGIKRINGRLFAKMGHLTSLDLSHNLLTEVTDTMFSQLTFSLVNLDLSHNNLKSITPFTLQHLQHLRLLNLDHNALTSIDNLQFPPHVRHLDLSHCALTIVDHCQLSNLADLSFIGLRGNDLKCTCQLYLLLKWYQDQHHDIGNKEDSIDSNWTCTVSNSTTYVPNAILATTINHPMDNMITHSPLGKVQHVLDLQECKDTASHCQTLEHFQHHQKGSSQIVVTLQVACSENTVMASWTFEENGEALVDGFQLHYMPEDADSITSPILSANVRSYVMKPSQLENHYRVCLDVLAHDMTVKHQECFKYEEEVSNITIGILAGLVFLIPCLSVLIFVFIKDRQFSKDLVKQHHIDTEIPLVTACQIQVNGNDTLVECYSHSDTETDILTLTTQKECLLSTIPETSDYVHRASDTESEGHVQGVKSSESIHAETLPSSKGSITDQTICVPNAVNTAVRSVAPVHDDILITDTMKDDTMEEAQSHI